MLGEFSQVLFDWLSYTYEDVLANAKGAFKQEATREKTEIKFERTKIAGFVELFFPNNIAEVWKKLVDTVNFLITLIVTLLL